MWQGFYVKSVASIAIFFGEIQDAQAAITLDDGAAAALYTVKFDRNHIGIRNGSATAGIASVNFTFFSDNIFDCTSPLLPPFNTLSPAHTGTSFAGIYLNTAVASIPSYWGTSFFRNMHFGLFLENTDAFVIGCDFQNMVTNPSVSFSNNGIRCINGALTVSNCYFNQATHGIWAEGSELDVYSNTFDVTGRSGLSSNTNLNTDFIYIRNNVLTIHNNFSGFTKTGIRVDRNSRTSAGNPTLTSLDISGNDITMNGLATNTFMLQQRGILVTAPFPSLDIGLISNNNITATATVDHRQNGIEIQAGLADRFRILGNNVVYNQGMGFLSTLRWGISMLYGNGINHRLQNNNCIGLGGNNRTGYCGIHMEDIPNVTMCGDSVHNFEHGIHFFGVFNNLGLWQNAMNDHLRSLRVQDNSNNMNMGFIGTHTRTANRWTLARNVTNNSTWTGTPPNRLTLPQNILPFSPTVFQGNILQFAPGPETACIQPATFGEEGEIMLTGYDIQISTGATGANTTSAWEEKRRLMYKLLRLPTLINEDISISNFYSNEYNTTAGQLAGVEYAIYGTIYQTTATQNSNLDMLDSQRISLLEQLQGMDEATGSISPTEALEYSIVSTRQEILNAWKTNFTNRSVQKQQIAIQRQASIPLAQQLLGSITASTAQEANWKTIFAIRLGQFSGIIPDESMLNQLRAIAAQCPDTAGSTAITALYMLPEEEWLQLLPHEETGLSGNCVQQRKSNNRTDPGSDIRVFPNPATDQVLVELPNEINGSWELRDINGRILLAGQLDQMRVFSIQIQAISQGIYTLRVRSLEDNVQFTKFLISR
jgi:hypothetical protein